MNAPSLIASRLLRTVPIVVLIATLNCLGGLCVYGIGRLLRVPGRRAMQLFGALLIVASLLVCLVTFWPRGVGKTYSNLLGVVSFLIAMYALGQWMTRRAHRVTKRGPSSPRSAWMRPLFLFLHRYHRSFGLLVAITATAHAVYFLPRLGQVSTARVLTGGAAWIILAALVGLGLWVERGAKRRLGRRVRTVHVVTALIFVAAFLVHV